MPYFEKGNMRMYYQDAGEGEPIIANHGVGEDCHYWSDTGVAVKLAESFRVISIDMRGHGRTVIEGEPYGYDADTMADDFDGLADSLGLERFHLLTHATGGMVGVRYAITRSDRLISLMLTDTGSATIPEVPGMDVDAFLEEFRKTAEWIKTSTVEERMARARENPGPFLFKMAEHPNNERMWEIADGFIMRGDPVANGIFRQSFYTDPDPRIKELRQIKCPTLILLGEFDIIFIRPSEILAQEIPNARHVILPGIGHMTAIEDPEGTIKEILNFLKDVGK